MYSCPHQTAVCRQHDRLVAISSTSSYTWCWCSSDHREKCYFMPSWPSYIAGIARIFYLQCLLIL